MTSTNMFQGLESNSKPSSRVLRPPGGTSSNLFGSFEEDAAPSRRTHKTATSIFTPAEDTQGGPRRSNPPGGKSSGIFGESAATVQQKRPVPPGGPSSNIFGVVESVPAAPSLVQNHPNKPKDNMSMSAPGPEPAVLPQPKVSQVEVNKEVKESVSPPATPAKEEPAPVPATPEPAPSTPTTTPSSTTTTPSSTTTSFTPVPQPSEKDHEPRLGPKPRSHNKVLNPPGGKSSVVFY